MTDEQLIERFHGLHKLVESREDDARAVLRGKHTQADLYRIVEGLIIDGADACQRFGPCPGCTRLAEKRAAEKWSKDT